MVAYRRRALQSNNLLTDSYIQDGLIMHLDGLNKSGDNSLDQDGSITSEYTWIDLTGNGHNLKLNSSNYMRTNRVEFNKGSLMTSPIDYTQAKHLEIVLYWWANNVTTNQCMLPWGGNNYTWVCKNQVFALRQSSGVNKGIAIEGTTKYSLSLEASSSLNTAYVNGEPATLATPPTSTWSAANPSLMFAYTSQGSYPFKGSLYAIRVYDHVLSEKEILHNWELDKERFKLWD